ncbi:MAG: AraC family transcriptional regulator ligand-binding domain-containing protein, partial [Hyphomicrobiales bacterium]
LKQIETPTTQVPFESIAEMFEYAAEELDNPHLGIHVAELTDVREWGLHVFCAYCADTLRETLMLKLRLYPLLTNAYSIEVADQGDIIEVKSIPVRPSFDAYGQLAEFADFATMKLYRALTGVHVVPIEMQYFHTSSGDPAEYMRTFGCPILFGQEDDRILYSKETMDLPVISKDSKLLQILMQHADSVLRKTDKAGSDFVGEIEKIMMRNLPKGRANIKAIARELGMSERTLARRLDALERPFMSILDRVRRDLAYKYIRQPELQLAQIAFLLGFSNQSSFNNAFKRWTGKTPKQVVS